MAGAYKAAGPDGLEWRIPVASIGSSEPLTVKKQETSELAELRAEVESLRVRATVAEQLGERDRQEMESLRQLLTAALEKVPKALTMGETPKLIKCSSSKSHRCRSVKPCPIPKAVLSHPNLANL